MRALIVLAAAIVFASLVPLNVLAEEELAGGVVEARLPAHQPNTYRFGRPLETAPGTTPGACELICNQNNACRAWSLVPVAAEQAPRCELKSSIGNAQYRPGATSGIAAHLQPPEPVALVSDDEGSGLATAPAIKPDPHPASAAGTSAPSGAAASSRQPMIFYPTKPSLLGGSGTNRSPRSLAPTPAPKPPAAPRPAKIQPH